MQVVEAADEEKVGDLFDDLQRVGDPIPDAIDLILNVTGDHGLPSEEFMGCSLLPSWMKAK